MDLTTIFGVLGSLTAFIMFYIPGQELYKVWEGPSMEQFSPIPHHAAFISSVLWVMYGFVHGDIFLKIIHAIGTLMAMSHLTLFLLFSNSFEEMMMHGVIFVSELSSIALLGYLACSLHDPDTFAGVVCAIGSILICAGKMAHDAKRTEGVPCFESLGSFANGVIWSVYGIISSDVFILVPNLVMALVNLVQLVQDSIHCYRAAERLTAEETEVLN